MDEKIGPLRYAHDEGHTDICYSSDGSKFITCGADGDIRIWSVDLAQDPIHNCVGELAVSVSQKGENIYVSTGSNDVQILTFPQGERNGVLDRFLAPINQIATSKNTDYIALAGEDMEVKLFTDASADKQKKVYDGLNGPCLSVALTPNAKLLASSSGDGKLRVWNVESDTLVHEKVCFPKVNSFKNAKQLCRIDFDRDSGSLLAYPENDSIVLLDTSDWSVKSTLKHAEITSAYSIVSFSPCSKYILGATIEGNIAVFDVAKGTLLKKQQHPTKKAICGLEWNPSGNGQVVFTDIEGQLGAWENSNLNPPSDAQPEENDDVDFGDVLFEDDDDEDNENAISIEKLKKETMGDAESELNFNDDRSSRAASPVRARTPEIPPQPPFMPSSTPEHLNPRYLCWNHVGVVRSYGTIGEEDVNKSIEVEFLDHTFHHSIMLPNYQDYTMGSLSKSALIVGNKSQINVIPLKASRKEWGLNLNDESQEIIAVSASDNLICFATTNYFVRVCSIFGTQRGVVYVPGPIVCLNSFNNLIMVAYHGGSVRGSDQCINIKLFRFDGMNVSGEEIGCALGPECLLQWMGFSDVGTPIVMDSFGIISFCVKKCWIPMCDTTEHRVSPLDGFFITSIAESMKTICGIKCKGSAYPGFIPTPVCCQLPLKPLFLDMNTEKGQYEANLFTLSNLQVENTNKVFVETAVKTFALACKNSLEERAVEFVEMLENPQILALATKYAVRLNKKFVVDKLMELTNGNEGEEEEVAVKTVTPDPRLIRKIHLSSQKKNQRDMFKTIKENSQKEITNGLGVTPLNDSLNDKTDENTPSTPIGEKTLSLDSQDEKKVEKTSERKNPFLKSAKNASDKKSGANPLSLTDKFAGVEYTDAKENKAKAEAEKRKQPDSESTKQKEKQRKLDTFMFSK